MPGDYDQTTLIDLNGSFRLVGPDGQEADISAKKSKALLAVVACAPNQKRSRHWLKQLLWNRSSEPQCSYSLRQTLSRLRIELNDFGDFFHSDRNYVWLTNVKVNRPDEAYMADEFFHDAAVREEPFQEWLARERQMIAQGFFDAVPKWQNRARGKSFRINRKPIFRPLRSYRALVG